MIIKNETTEHLKKPGRQPGSSIKGFTIYLFGAQRLFADKKYTDRRSEQADSPPIGTKAKSLNEEPI